MLRTLRPISALRPKKFLPRRTFIDLPGTSSQTLTETRILPYPSSSLYKIIADVDSYSTFLPYCLSSCVTSWSSPDSTSHRWPARADLTIGWKEYTETFTSKLFCVSDSVVEAHSGASCPATTIPASSLQHYDSAENGAGIENSIFESLLTRWTVKPFHYLPPTGQPQTDKTQHSPRDQTEVNLSIEYRFKNQMYGVLTQAVTPKVAAMMVDAFERRVKEVWDGPGAGLESHKGAVAEMGKKMGM